MSARRIHRRETAVTRHAPRGALGQGTESTIPPMALSHDLERIAAEAAAYAASGERVAGILAAEPLEIGRIYLCAYESGADHAWLAFDDEGTPVADRYRVRA